MVGETRIVGAGPEMGPGSMGSNILCRNVLTGPRQGQDR